LNTHLLPELILSVTFFVAGIITAVVVSKTKVRSSAWAKPLNSIIAGTFLSLVPLFLSAFQSGFSDNVWGKGTRLLVALQATIQVFTVNADFGMIQANLSGASGWIATAYLAFAAMLYVFAPILTAGFLLSYVQNFSAYQKYLLNRTKDVFVFSKLNERSLALAKSELETHKANHKKAIIVFADVNVSDKEPSAEWIEEAKGIGAILFKEDILTVRWNLHSKKSTIRFFVIGDDEPENMEHTMTLHEKYAGRQGTQLYMLSSTLNSSLLLSGKEGEIKLRRVDEIQSLVYRTLYDNGTRIFDSAHREGDIKAINVVLVGLGRHGSEMLKALTWFGQMEGYALTIHAYDIDYTTEDKLRQSCPELLDDDHNGKNIPGEAAYSVTFHCGYDVKTAKFSNSVSSVKNPTYVLVSLGSDEINIETAVHLRTLFKRQGYEPIINAIIWTSKSKSDLNSAANFKNEKYEVECIGDLETLYSDSVIVNSDLGKIARERHCKWGIEEDFYRYEYNYRSSIASAIHKKMRLHCEIPGTEKTPDMRTEEEKQTCRVLEHRRWNAYMRSEGYSYSGSLEKSSRCDLAKLHHCLVPFEELSEEEKAKDDD